MRKRKDAGYERLQNETDASQLKGKTGLGSAPRGSPFPSDKTTGRSKVTRLNVGRPRYRLGVNKEKLSERTDRRLCPCTITFRYEKSPQESWKHDCDIFVI